MGKLLSVSVMAHPSRKEWFPYLREKLDNAPFAIDDDGRGVWENCKAAWRLHDPEALYHVVIQDDAIICDNFHERVTDFIQLHHDPNWPTAFSLYMGNQKRLKPQADAALKKGYWEDNRNHWGLAIMLPVGLIGEMIQRCDNFHNPQDDVRIGRYLQEEKIRVKFPVPSLVDHRTGTVSLVGDPGQNRCAFYFIDNFKNGRTQEKNM